MADASGQSGTAVMQVKAMLGSESCEKASNGAKKFEVTVADDTLYDLWDLFLKVSAIWRKVRIGEGKHLLACHIEVTL